MPPVDIQAIRQRLEKASAYPWINDSESGFIESASEDIVCQMWDKMEDDFDNKEANMDLIAHAPADLRALCDELQAARDEVELLLKYVSHMPACSGKRAWIEQVMESDGTGVLRPVTRYKSDPHWKCSCGLAELLEGERS